MNPLVRFVSVTVALATALFISGCMAPASSRASRPKVTREFAIVESSTGKELTPAQVAELRDAVARYLREQGLGDRRTYDVKATFPSTNPDETPEWAIVRIGGQVEGPYTVIAAYPGGDDYYPYDFYRTNYSSSNYYPGYAGFSRWGYYDPFDYNYGYYSPPIPPRDHKPDNPDGKKPDHPPSGHTRWQDQPRRPSGEPRDWPGHRYPTHQNDIRRWSREPADGRDHRSRPDHSRPDRPERSPTPPERSDSSPERSYAPLPERSFTPPPAPSYNPPADTSSSRSEPMTNVQSTREKER